MIGNGEPSVLLGNRVNHEYDANRDVLEQFIHEAVYRVDLEST